ncbi:Starch-binding associating with outer membrane [Filimonas lacunae]|uniref:Starch-binding associating with outer membrane n=1 Tax=Filimonas lacunae TaxID=477680 RepID=A0A173MI54_9BACT|nr:RagB/SusD family nutrient uptake outer membrane protein [Filimonas lacunae]BAV07170.1 outer membrane protein SusD [Filimonas lacunae]SIS93868.1 Starch-binding associating with outer membrane [Filimonas lacunae]
MKMMIQKISILLLAVAAFSGCTKLEEERYGSLSPETYYSTEAEALSSVVGVYQLLSYTVHIGDPWRIAEFGTDEFIVPGRASGGWYDASNIEIIQHKVTPANATSGRAWTNIFQEIGTANAVLESLNASPNAANLKAVIAETRALRAYGYFYAMDFWGNVPLVTVARIDPNNLPTTTRRADVFKFVETEMTAALADLPSVNNVNRTAYYPRFTREAIFAALATMYLNAEVYTGTPQWEKAAAMCDSVIKTGAYSLEANVGDNFSSTNKKTFKEVISSFSVDPAKNAGGNQFILYTQHALDKLKYNLPFTPADGYSTYQEALDRYENVDKRKGLIEYGPQTYLDGTPLLQSNGQQLVLVPVKDLVSAEDNEGYKVLKYTPIGTTWSGYNGDNDLVLLRYSDILLTKAEALFRISSSSGVALDLVNQVRGRSNASQLGSLTLKNLEEERAREFIWEGHRRRDMIRFGSYFTSTWAFKTGQTETYRGIYPIPSEQITANPKLEQNTGYPKQ